MKRKIFCYKYKEDFESIYIINKNCHEKLLFNIHVFIINIKSYKRAMQSFISHYFKIMFYLYIFKETVSKRNNQVILFIIQNMKSFH